MPSSRMRCCVSKESSTVIVSPSAMRTTRPVRIWLPTGAVTGCAGLGFSGLEQQTLRVNATAVSQVNLAECFGLNWFCEDNFLRSSLGGFSFQLALEELSIHDVLVAVGLLHAQQESC